MLVAVIMCGLFALNHSTYAATTVVAGGIHGIDSIKWTLYSNGALMITGTVTVTARYDNASRFGGRVATTVNVKKVTVSGKVYTIKNRKVV